MSNNYLPLERRPFLNAKRLKSLLLAVGFVSTAGAGLAVVGSEDNEQSTFANKPITAEESKTLDQVEQAWASQATSTQGAAKVDPYVKQTAATGDRYGSVARGQQPGVRPISAPLTTGNPLRSSRALDQSPASVANGIASTATSNRARQAFGETRTAVPPAYNTANPASRTAAPLRMELGAEARPSTIDPNVQQVAAPAEALPIAHEFAGEFATEEPAANEFVPLPPEPNQYQEANELAATLPAETVQPIAEPADSVPAEMFAAEQPAQETPVQEPADYYQEQPTEQPTQSIVVNNQPRRTATRSKLPAVTPAPATDFGNQTPLTGFDTSTAVAATAGRPGERALEGRQQPTLAIQKFAPAEIQVGKECKFLVKVRNDSPRPVMGVVVSDQTPRGTRLMSTSPQAETTGEAIRWQLGSMSAGEERTMEMTVLPLEEGEIGSIATVSFVAQASAKTKCTKPQLALRLTAPSKVLAGQQQRVKIEIRNAGTGDASKVVLFENVPEQLRHEAGPTLEFEVGTLRAGETRQMELVLTAEKPGRVTNTLTARAEGNLQVEQSVEFDVVAPALEVAVDGPSRRYLERPATYQVRVENPGTAAAKDLRLVTHLPRGMRFVKANNMGEYDAATHSIYWSLAELPEGEGGTVELTAMPMTPGDLQIKVEGQAQGGLKHEASRDVRVEGISAINFEVLDLEDPIEVGGETQYEIRVSNQGTKASSNVRVRVEAPAGMRVVSAAGETPHTVDAGGVTFQPIVKLAPQAETMFRIRVQGVQPGDHRLGVEVSTDDLAQPVRKEESTRVFGDE